jgi:hypothetical protein
LLLLLSWPVTFLFLLVVYWSPKTCTFWTFPISGPCTHDCSIGDRMALCALSTGATPNCAGNDAQRRNRDRDWPFDPICEPISVFPPFA